MIARCPDGGVLTNPWRMSYPFIGYSHNIWRVHKQLIQCARNRRDAGKSLTGAVQLGSEYPR